MVAGHILEEVVSLLETLGDDAIAVLAHASGSDRPAS
jgi:hypothetical protein